MYSGKIAVPPGGGGIRDFDVMNKFFHTNKITIKLVTSDLRKKNLPNKGHDFTSSVHFDKLKEKGYVF
jgi:hypothetical protein